MDICIPHQLVVVLDNAAASITQDGELPAIERKATLVSCMLLSACATFGPQLFKQADTQLLGASADSLNQLHGTYKVLDQMGTHFSAVDTFRAIKENGKPVFRFYDKKDEEILVLSPRKCDATPAKVPSAVGVSCGNIAKGVLESMASYEPLIPLNNLPIEYKVGDALFGYRKLTVRPGAYSLYVSWISGPNAKFELKRVDENMDH